MSGSKPPEVTVRFPPFQTLARVVWDRPVAAYRTECDHRPMDKQDRWKRPEVLLDSALQAERQRLPADDAETIECLMLAG